MKIEFENINELKEFAELIIIDTSSKEEATTEEMNANKDFLYKNNIDELFLKQSETNLKLLNSLKECVKSDEEQLIFIQALNEDIDKLKNDLNNNNVYDFKEDGKLTRKQSTDENNKYKLHYPSSISYPKIKKLYPNGYFKLSNNNTSPYTIQDILKLKNGLNNGLNLFELNKLVPEIVQNTVSRICYGIENNYYEPFIKEWEQLQAKEFESRVKSVEVINNPQKRREQGMI